MRRSSRLEVARAAAAVALCLLALPVAADHHTAWHRGVDASLGYDSNAGNAAAADDERDNAFIAAGANLDYTWQPTLNTGLLLRGGLAGEGYEQDTRLSSGKASLMARLSHRPAGGFYVPLLAGWASAAYRQSGSEIRSGAEFRAGAYLMMPVTTAIGARLSLGVGERMASGSVFDLSTRSAGLDLDWRVARRLTTYLGYQFVDGDLVSSSSQSPSGPYYGDEVERDDAFDGFWAYRLDAQTQLVTAGLNFALSGATAVDVQLLRADASADAGGYDVGYDRWQAVVSLLMRL